MSTEEAVRQTLERLTGVPPEATRKARPVKRITRAQGKSESVPGFAGDVRDSADDDLFALPASAPALPDWAEAADIAGFGIAEKVTAGKLLQDIVLKVYVEKKLPLSRLKAAVPKLVEMRGLPAIETDVQEIGKVVPQSFTARVRPAMPGYSIGRALEPAQAGTFGMLVRKIGQKAPFYLLSNAHAIANSGFATVGDIIVQPGCADGGTAQADRIGTLAEWVPLQFTDTGFPNTVDAAIALLDDDVATAAIALLGVPAGVSTRLSRGMLVQKVGRTTTFSVAQVQDVDLRIPSTYPMGTGMLGRVGFSDQVLVSFYSAGGDSGSPVLDMDKQIVGLHMAGSNQIGIFCKIENVLKQLGVEVVTAQNLP